MAYNIRQKISNHHIFTDVERWVVVTRLAINADVQQMILDGYVEYQKDEEDLTNSFKSKIENWVVSNDYKVAMRDETGTPIPNPDYVDEDTTPDVDPYIMVPAFDYYHGLMLGNLIPPQTLLSMAILGDDLKGEFNF